MIPNSRGGSSSSKPLIVGLIFLVFGLVVVFHVPLFSCFRLAQTGPTDPRLNNYILERNHQWFAGDRGHEQFWSPPFFHPWEDIGTHTESLIGLQPFYSVWRVTGLEPELAYQLCSMGLLAACYIAMWLLLRRGFGAGSLGSALGAFLFAFSSPRSHQLGHVQLFAHYAMPIAVLGLVLELRDHRTNPREWRWVALFGAAMVVQLYASLYLAWYCCLLLLVAGLSAVLCPGARRAVWESLRAKPVVWISSAIGTAALSLPLLLPYLSANRRIPGTPYERIFLSLPQWPAFLFQGSGSWVGQMTGMNGWYPIVGLPSPEEQAMGVGLLTTALFAAGLWIKRRDSATACLAVVTLVTLMLLFRFPGGFSLWRWGYEILPGSAAFRAAGRFVLPMLVIGGVGVAAAVDRLREAAGSVIAVALALLVVVEQTQTQSAYDWHAYSQRTKAIAETIPADCDAFFYSRIFDLRSRTNLAQVDAMWAGLHAGVPTVNGYSGYPPRGWRETVKRSIGTPPRPNAAEMMTRGLSEAGAGGENVCWIRLEVVGPLVISSEITRLTIPDHVSD